MNTLSLEELGARVRRARLARGFTLKDVQALADVSATHVSEIERGRTSPTVGALDKIARALNVELAALIEPGAEPSLAITRAGARAAVALAETGAVLEPLSIARADTRLSLFRVVIGAGGHTAPRSRFSRGEDVVEVLEGQLEVACEAGGLALTPGRSFHLKRTVSPIEFSNRGPSPVAFLWATAPKLAF